MNQKIHIIENEEQLRTGMGLIDSSKELGLDTETYANDKTWWSSPHNAEIRLLQLSNDSDSLLLDFQKIPYELATEVLGPKLSDPSVIKVLHNAKYDLKFIKKHLKTDVEGIFDSMLASILIEGGRKTGKGYHGLEQTLKRYTDLDITKDEQTSDWSGELTESQIKYAAMDSQCLLPLREKITPTLIKLGLKRVAKLEFDFVLPVAWLELCGFYLDFEEWRKVALESKQKSEETADKIFELLQPVLPQGNLFGNETINLDSSQQVMKYFTALGIPMPEGTREWMLTPLAAQYPIVQLLLDYRGYQKGVTTFGETYEEFINPVTGRIHADYRTIGADTGRTAPSNPNLAQIPKEDKYRSCFKAQEGNTLVSGDWSQIELRILADLAKDKNAIQAFASGVDFHYAMASKVFRKPIDQVTSEERTFAKRVAFGIPYGLGLDKLAMQCNLPVAEASLIRSMYFDEIKAEKRWIDFQKQQVLRTRSARTVAGRLCLLGFDENDGMQRSMVQRKAVNSPIQGSSADILKRALRLFYNSTKHLQDKIKLVNIVHDQIDTETPKDLAEEVANILKDDMEKAGKEFLHLVEVKADINISERYKKD